MGEKDEDPKKKKYDAETRAFQERIREFIAEGTKAQVLLERSRCMRALVAVLNEEPTDLKTALERVKRLIEGGSGSAFTTREAVDLDDFAIRAGTAVLKILNARVGLKATPWGKERFQAITKNAAGQIHDESGEDLVVLLEKLAEHVPKKPFVAPPPRRPWEGQIKKEKLDEEEFVP